MQGFLRSDGRKGIRNYVVVAYLVECAHHVAREIALPLREQGVHLIGFPGCYPNAYADRIMRRICTHPNVGAVLLVSLGLREFQSQRPGRNRPPVRPAGRDAGHPADRRHAVDDPRRPRVGRAGPEAVARHAPLRDGRRRPGRGHDLRRLRRHQRADGQPGDRQGLRLAGRSRRGGHLRGDQRDWSAAKSTWPAGPSRRNWAANCSPPWSRPRTIIACWATAVSPPAMPKAA